MSMIFKVGTKDYTSHVIDGSYKINKIPKYKAWSDGFGNRHRDQRAAKHEGTLELMFKSMTDHSTFLADLVAAKYNAELQYTLTIVDNNNAPDTSVEIHAFVDINDITRALKGDKTEYVKAYKVTITES